jgi:uncharacterized protein YejL (UPF0352 family)
VTDAALHRVDQILTELIETVETARAVPMSTSCVVPRERMLDLFDDLREVLPPEMIEARRLITERDTVVSEAQSGAEEMRVRAAEAADAIVADAQHQADDLRVRAEDHARQLIEVAEAQARELVEAGRAEHGHLVSATGVHQAAARESSRLRSEADEYSRLTRSEAETYATTLTAEADQHSARLRAESDAYVKRILSELLEVLQKASRTTEKGLDTLAARRASGPT